MAGSWAMPLMGLVLLLQPASVAAEVAVGATGEEVNPYTEAGDSTQECYAWAADGQCTMNPGHMLTQCKYSCWEWFKYRREKYPDAPIDKSMDCHSWAQQGECGKNPTFMKPNCPEACKEKGYDPPEPPPSAGGAKKKKKSKKKKKKADDKEE